MKKGFSRKDLIEYHLGMIRDEKLQSEIDQSLISDDEIRLEIEIVQSEMVDEYVSGVLDTKYLERFERKYLYREDWHNEVSKWQFLSDEARRLKDKEQAELLVSDNSNKLEPAGLSEFIYSRIEYIAFSGIVLFFLSLLAIGSVVGKGHRFVSPSPTNSLFISNRTTESRVKGLPYGEYVGVNVREENRFRRLSSKNVEYKLRNMVMANPTSKTHKDLGVFYHLQSKFDSALCEFEHAAEYSSEKVACWAEEAATKYEMAKISSGSERRALLIEALHDANKAIEMGDSLPVVLFNRALIIEKLESPDVARHAWEKFIAVSDDPSWTSEAKTRISQLN